MSLLDGPNPDVPEMATTCDYCDADVFVGCCLCDANLCRKHNRTHKCQPEEKPDAD